MRACFLGQNVCALGFGVATLQTPPLVVDEETGKPADLLPDADGRTRPARTEPVPPKAGIRPL
jgi:hypothetical protein